MTSNDDNVGLKYEDNMVNPSPFFSTKYWAKRINFT
jgi:hypothetical protein